MSVMEIIWGHKSEKLQFAKIRWGLYLGDHGCVMYQISISVISGFLYFYLSLKKNPLFSLYIANIKSVAKEMLSAQIGESSSQTVFRIRLCL